MGSHAVWQALHHWSQTLSPNSYFIGGKIGAPRALIFPHPHPKEKTTSLKHWASSELAHGKEKEVCPPDRTFEVLGRIWKGNGQDWDGKLASPSKEAVDHMEVCKMREALC